MTEYEWINFKINLQKLPWRSWVKLGECVAKCEQIKIVPLMPDIRNALHLVYLAKGVHATTAIEGNTLSEDQVKALIEKKLVLPASKKYLAQEVNNILEACNEIASEIQATRFLPFTVDRLCQYNNKVLQNDVPCDEAAIPGVIRKHNVVIGNVYRAPDAADAYSLVQEFCDWMNSDDFADEQMPFHFAIIKAVAAHLYVAWIHPFGDGNGRVARLLEFAILLTSGVPSPAAHLMSNHYNMTRSEYYAQLDRASKTGDPTGFFSYAIEGFLDGLEEQLQYIQRYVVTICWRDYIYEVFRSYHSHATAKRRRELALTISAQGGPVDREAIFVLMRNEYKDRTEKTFARDLNELQKMQLVVKEGDRYAANKALILQLRPFSMLP